MWCSPEPHAALHDVATNSGEVFVLRSPQHCMPVPQSASESHPTAVQSPSVAHVQAAKSLTHGCGSVSLS